VRGLTLFQGTTHPKCVHTAFRPYFSICPSSVTTKYVASDCSNKQSSVSQCMCQEETKKRQNSTLQVPVTLRPCTKLRSPAGCDFNHADALTSLPRASFAAMPALPPPALQGRKSRSAVLPCCHCLLCTLCFKSEDNPAKTYDFGTKK